MPPRWPRHPPAAGVRLPPGPGDRPAHPGTRSLPRRLRGEHTEAMTGRARVRTGVAAAVVTAEVVAAIVLTLVLGLSWTEALEGFVVTNALMGLSFGLCGAVIAWHRPRNPVGWLLVADGIGHATTAMAAPLAAVLAEQGAPLVAQRLAATVAACAWPWSIGLFLPLALLLFPTGRLPSPRWRIVAIAYVVTAPLFVLELGTEPEPILAGTPAQLPQPRGPRRLGAAVDRLRAAGADVHRAGAGRTRHPVPPRRGARTQPAALAADGDHHGARGRDPVGAGGGDAGVGAVRDPVDPDRDHPRDRPAPAARHPAS